MSDNDKKISTADVRKNLKKFYDPERAKTSAGFFKTGKGDYAAGDVFIGVAVPEVREVSRKFISLPFVEIEKILKSPIQEERLAGFLILVDRFYKFPEERKKIFDFYHSHLESANNWDLVDLSADKIMGEWLSDKRDRNLLYKLSRSKNLWRRRAAMVATHAFIKRGELDDAFKIADALLEDGHDLIRKAVGWMLREAGKVDESLLENFIRSKIKKMSRVTLRYAIERFPEPKRKRFLSL